MSERIAEHPILGVQEKGRLVRFQFDGKKMGFILWADSRNTVWDER